MSSFHSTQKRTPLRERNKAVKRGAEVLNFEEAPVAKRQETGPQQPETFEDLSRRTGQAAEDVLNKKLSFKKRCPEKEKVTIMGAYLKELRCVGHYLQQHKDQLESKLSEQIAKADNQNESISKLQSDYSQERQILQNELATCKHQLQSVEKQHQSCKETCSEFEGQNKSLEQQLCTTRKEVEQLQGSFTKMQLELEHTKQYSLSLQEYNHRLQQDLDSKRKALEEIVSAKNQMAEEVSVLKGQRTVLQDELSSVKLKFDEGEQCKHATLAELNKVQSELKIIRQERDDLQTLSEQQNVEITEYKSVNGDTVDELKAARTARDTLQIRCDSQVQMIDMLKRDLAKSNDERDLFQKISETRLQDINELQEQNACVQEKLREAEQKLLEGEQIRRQLHNTIQELRGNIRVFCRVKPPQNEEDILSVGFPPSLDVQQENITLTAPEPVGMSQTEGQKYQFQFDRVFQQQADQEAVFGEISQLVQSALDGYKVCIFAYGQTGSGKTFTMLGTPDFPGCIPRAMKQIFKTGTALGAHGWKFTMTASMIEIYNEEIRDLLAKGTSNPKKHNITHDANGSTQVSDILVYDVSTPEKVDSLLQRAMVQRAVGETACNEFSSRSHMVFTLKIEGINEGTQQKIRGVLNLVDLAGSERLKESQAQGIRMKETQNINKSLSALGDVIFALSNKQDHIPYRNSKLTYLLQNSLGGDAKTLMFVNINPSQDAFGESLCSLRFAAKVNSCEIKPARKNTSK
eukprot:TRINITY_DN9423_c0_g1_i1.p1 TRINITY_DN9423_c0_g1~~TRINITY_DN9423_c0_g1_i1.p1  ORF type:complete len:779 (-),score=101.75 TRINITY_DN9423_c0_g1_i1:610-2850(-)